MKIAPVLVAAHDYEKKLLTAAPAAPLPREILDRPKTGFLLPIREWLKPEAGSPHTFGMRSLAMMLTESLYWQPDRHRMTVARIRLTCTHEMPTTEPLQRLPLAPLRRPRLPRDGALRRLHRLRRLHLRRHHEEIRLSAALGSAEPRLLRRHADRPRHDAPALAARAEAQSRRLSRGEEARRQPGRVPLRRRQPRALPAELRLSRHGVPRDAGPRRLRRRDRARRASGSTTACRCAACASSRS